MSQAWSRYWARDTSGACLPDAPQVVQQRLIDAWTALGRELTVETRLLDIASGGGSVLRVLRERSMATALTGIDAADVGPAAALVGVKGGVDAHSLPFAEASFDVVTSQFGIEYCQARAWTEAVRVLRPGGQVQFICHHARSHAVLHNARRLAALRAVVNAGLFTLAEAVARTGHEDHRLVAAVMAARQAHADQPVASELPSALGQWARVRRIDAVMSIRAEAEAEIERLTAMQSAALDHADLTTRLAWLAPLAPEVEVLDDPAGTPIAWLVRARRP